jgi:hypothetical protein
MRCLPRRASVGLLALLTVSCAFIAVEGSGDVITEEREVSGFDHIEISGSGRVVVRVTGVESLSIEAEDNIMPELVTEVRGGRLHLETRRSIDPTVEIVYNITAASLDGFTISGSANVTVEGVTGDEFSTEISGSGSVVGDGTVTSVVIAISGSGRFDGEGLTAASGSVDVSGSGAVVVSASDQLAISLSGSGTVEYIGSPTVEVDKSGSGTITQRD